MSEEEFSRHKEALAAQRLEKPKQLSGQTSLYWGEITAQQYHFDRANEEVAYLRTITKDEILTYYKVKYNNCSIGFSTFTIYKFFTPTCPCLLSP